MKQDTKKLIVDILTIIIVLICVTIAVIAVVWSLQEETEQTTHIEQINQSQIVITDQSFYINTSKGLIEIPPSNHITDLSNNSTIYIKITKTPHTSWHYHSIIKTD